MTGPSRTAGGPLRVAMVGHGFMGSVHTQAWRTAPSVFATAAVELAVVCGRDEISTRDFASRWRWGAASTNWRDVVARSDVDIVDICVPGASHHEIAVAALNAGKHVICEKPLANSITEAKEMEEAAIRARRNGARTMLGFNYRRTPALALARELVSEDRLGAIRHIRASYLQDWIVDPDFPLVWRLQRELSGSGALGDLGAHIIDIAEYVSAQRISSVSATLHTFVSRRPIAASSSGLTGAPGSALGDVTVDDAAFITARLSSGIIATFEATRFATGRKNAMQIEINGSLGSITFDFEAMNELRFYDATDDSRGNGFRRILVTEPDHPYASAWWPPGHGLGYEHTFIHEVADFLDAISSGTEASPNFTDGLGNQRILDAIEKSAANDSTWTTVEQATKGITHG